MLVRSHWTKAYHIARDHAPCYDTTWEAAVWGSLRRRFVVYLITEIHLSTELLSDHFWIPTSARCLSNLSRSDCSSSRSLLSLIISVSSATLCKQRKRLVRSGANFIELLSREFCLANIFVKHFKTDYQPKYINFTCKFGWYPRKSAKQIFLVSNFLCLAALWNWPQVNATETPQFCSITKHSVQCGVYFVSVYLWQKMKYPFLIPLNWYEKVQFKRSLFYPVPCWGRHSGLLGTRRWANS